MSTFYSNSSKPRTFDYQNTKSNYPLELKGTSKRPIVPQDSLGSNLGYRNDGQTSNTNASSRLPDTRRTLIPDYNKENIQTPSIRVSQHGQDQKPGNLMTLFNKTGDDSDKYEKLRRNKTIDVSKESNPISSEKRLLRPMPLKEKYDFKSEITTLPITNQLREEPKAINPMRNYATAYAKEKYDMMSSINTLPGSLNKRDDGTQNQMVSRGIGGGYRNMNIGTSETPTEKTTFRGITSSSCRNQGSNSALDQTYQINPLSKPRKASAAREKLYSQSKDEYFGHQESQKRFKPSGARDIFKSSIQLQ